MTTIGWIVSIAAFVVAAVIFFLLGIRYRKNVAEREISSAEEEATRIINEAIKSSENKKREALLEAKEEILKSRSEYEREVKERRADLQKQERRLQQKEENLDHKMDSIEKKEEALTAKHAAADKAAEEIKNIKHSQMEMLERISGFTADEAKDYLIAQVESDVTHETAIKIKEIDARSRAVTDRLHNGLIPLRRRDGGVCRSFGLCRRLLPAGHQQQRRCAQQAAENSFHARTSRHFLQTVYTKKFGIANFAASAILSEMDAVRCRRESAAAAEGVTLSGKRTGG